jgi:segregation and condensation protein A
MEYQVDLETFRGPLDLLLFLVKRQEVDVREIPIARLAEQFLEYMSVIELIDVEHAGDFLVMAATLMEIKSKLLLPRTEEDEEFEPDPRLELVKQLMEYKRFKDAALLLEAKAEKQLARLPRQPIDAPAGPDPAHQPLRSVELWDLVSAFGRLMRETLALQPQQIVVDDTPIHVYQETVRKVLERTGRSTFQVVFTGARTRARLVGLFLAILELVKNQEVIAEQEGDFGDIVLCLAAPTST